MTISNNIKIALFAYNFPHKKTQDFLFRLIFDGLIPNIVISTNWKDIKIPKPTQRVKPYHFDLIHPKEICARFGINYYVLDHNSEICCKLLRENKISIGVISGARILGQAVINSVSKGIINIHPGILPEARGLDALQWAIIENRPLGVTSHIINRYIDQGRIIIHKEIPEYSDDSLIDLSLRLEQTQTTILSESINLLHSYPIDHFKSIDNRYPLHHKMPPDQERLLGALFSKRINEKKKNEQ